MNIVGKLSSRSVSVIFSELENYLVLCRRFLLSVLFTRRGVQGPRRLIVTEDRTMVANWKSLFLTYVE